MLLSVADLVSTLRTEVSISNTAAGVEDQGLIDLTDEQIVTLITLGATRLNTDADSLEELMEEGNYEYPLMLLAKMELITTLSTLSAKMVDMNADNNNRLSLGQRFQHYSKLLDQLKDAYDAWNSDNDASTGGTGGVVTTYDVVLSKRYMSLRNYQLQPNPRVKVRIKGIDLDSALIEWSITGFDHFGMCRMYIGTEPVIDPYLDGGKAQNKVTNNAKLLKSTIDIRDNHVRIKGLLPSTDYYVAVVSIEKNGVFGYAQKKFSTLEDESEG